MNKIPGLRVMRFAVDGKKRASFQHIKIFFHYIMLMGRVNLMRQKPANPEVELRSHHQIFGPVVAMAVRMVFFIGNIHSDLPYIFIIQRFHPDV